MTTQPDVALSLSRARRSWSAPPGTRLPYGELTEVGQPGSLLGVVADFDVSEQSCELGAGDALVLFTDGITERRREGHLFEEHLPSTLRGSAGVSATGLAERVEEAALAFATTTPDDDMAVLVLGVPVAPDTVPALSVEPGGHSLVESA